MVGEDREIGMDLKDLIKQAHLPEKTVELCLRGDLQAEWETLERQLTDRRKRPSVTMADDGEAREIAARMADLESEMGESTITIRLRALRRDAWMKLTAEHQARDDDKLDQAMGINRDTFYDALVSECWIEPELSETDLAELLGMLTSSQFDTVFEAAWNLNRKDVSVPFSPSASRISQSTGETSRQQPDSESPTDDGADGNPKK